MSLLSVIIPAYNEENLIGETSDIISGILRDNSIDYEIIFVDDGSKDHTWQEIEKSAANNNCVHGVKFSRNFGKESAIIAGLASAVGDCCVVIDCDLQHPPQAMLEMYSLWQQGYEVVEGRKNQRGKESLGYKLSAGLFYKIISKATKLDMANTSDYKLLDRKAVDALLSLPEKNCFFRALSSWIGYKSTAIYYDVQERQVGESKWSTRGLIKYAVSNIMAFSALPMQLVTFAGLITFVFAFVLGVQSLYRYLSGQALEGFTTIILLILIIGSVVMISLGIIGFYIAKIYDEIKGRPKYIISRKL